MSSPPPGNPPSAEVVIDGDLVAALLADQHPDLADLPLRRAAEGWDNITYRLGPEMAVRLPRRLMAARLIEHEQRWLPEISRHVSLPIPAPIRRGAPSTDYPWSWSVVPWIQGVSVAKVPLLVTEAPRLGKFLRSLHTIDLPIDPPQNRFRGGALGDRIDVYRDRFAQMEPALGGESTDRADRLFRELAAVPIDVAATWLHGDLHSKNVLSDGGELAAVIDWGDICTGDPATDLASAWILFPTSSHHGFFDGYGPLSDGTRQRSAAWALAFGSMLWESHHVADPVFADIGLETIRRVLATN